MQHSSGATKRCSVFAKLRSCGIYKVSEVVSETLWKTFYPTTDCMKTESQNSENLALWGMTECYNVLGGTFRIMTMKIRLTIGNVPASILGVKRVTYHTGLHSKNMY